MNERLADIRRRVWTTRQRLEGWVHRVAELRDRVRPAGEPATAAPATPLFQGPGPGPAGIEDVELHFEALDTEDGGRGKG
jgi:hypothetical protein